MPSQKLCLFCRKFFIDAGSPHYSDLTPGDAMSIQCTANHWSIDTELLTSESYARKMLQAIECEDFEPSSLAKELRLVD